MFLRALDHYEIEALEKATGDLFVKNQMTVQALTNVDYRPILELNEASDTLKKAQENIKDFYALLENQCRNTGPYIHDGKENVQAQPLCQLWAYQTSFTDQPQQFCKDGQSIPDAIRS